MISLRRCIYRKETVDEQNLDRDQTTTLKRNVSDNNNFNNNNFRSQWHTTTVYYTLITIILDAKTTKAAGQFYDIISLGVWRECARIRRAA